MTTSQLAKVVELDSEHKSFYKLYSKFVHPSSVLVNKPENIKLDIFMNVLLINAQLYAADTYRRVADSVGINIQSRDLLPIVVPLINLEPQSK